MQAAAYIDKDPEGHWYAGMTVQSSDGVIVQFPVGNAATIDKNVDEIVKNLRTIRADLKRAESGIILPEGLFNGKGNLRS
jgi:hypothetical protein